MHNVLGTCAPTEQCSRLEAMSAETLLLQVRPALFEPQKFQFNTHLGLDDLDNWSYLVVMLRFKATVAMYGQPHGGRHDAARIA